MTGQPRLYAAGISVVAYEVRRGAKALLPADDRRAGDRASSGMGLEAYEKRSLDALDEGWIGLNLGRHPWPSNPEYTDGEYSRFFE